MKKLRRRGFERRRHGRFPVDTPARLMDSTGEVSSLQFENIGRGGACLTASKPLTCGDRVEICLGFGLFVLGEVIRTEKLESGEMSIAIRFVSDFQEADEELWDDATKLGAFQLELKEIQEEAFSYYDRLKRVREWVLSNLHDSVSLEGAAEIAAMERTAFSDFFHRKVGVTFSSWVQYLRIRNALEMLRTHNFSITEVAFAVGFNELSTFQKAFKRWTSLTPREFKKLARPA